MIMSDSEVEERLESSKNICVVIEKSNGNGAGRPLGSTTIPDSVRKLLAITKSSSSDTNEKVGEVFGVDGSQVSRASRGMIGDRLNKELQGISNTAKENREESAHEAALDVLMTSLSQLQPKLLDPELKPKELSRIAADMSKVARDMKPREDNPGTVNNTQVILFSPPRKKLDKYDFIEA